MPLFDRPTQKYPRTWREMSLDFRLFFAWHGSMMFLMVTSAALGVKNELTLAAVLAFVLITAGIRRREEKDWHWRGAETKHWLMAIGQLALFGFFGITVTQMFSPSKPAFVPITLALGGMCVFNTLTILRLTYMSEEEFLGDCGPVISAAPIAKTPTDPTWKRAVRGAFFIGFMTCWLGGVGSIYIFGKAEKSGALSSTAERTERLEDHGRVVYVLPGEKKLIDELELVGSLGFPFILIFGLLIHFVLKIQLFPNTPTNFKDFRVFLKNK